jgi:hypothetical protein
MARHLRRELAKSVDELPPQHSMLVPLVGSCAKVYAKQRNACEEYGQLHLDTEREIADAMRKELEIAKAIIALVNHVPVSKVESTT